jgi:hypothetical protein
LIAPWREKEKKKRRRKWLKVRIFLHAVNAEASTRTVDPKIKCWAEKNNALYYYGKQRNPISAQIILFKSK